MNKADIDHLKSSGCSVCRDIANREFESAATSTHSRNLVELAEKCLELAEHGDYSNGIVGPGGGPDEGDVLSYQRLKELRTELDRAKSVKVTYRGWPGHYIVAKDCIFRLNTLVEVGEIRYVVSTVGNLQPRVPIGSKIEKVGCDYYYETMVFRAALVEGGYWDQDSGNPVLTKHCVEKITIDSDQKAQEMHEAAVGEIIGQILGEELK